VVWGALLAWFVIYPDLYYMMKYNGFSKAVSSLTVINYKKLAHKGHQAVLEYSNLERPSAF